MKLEKLYFLVQEEEEKQIIEKLNWLKINIDPWTTIKKYWEDTSAYRIKQLIGSPLDYDYTSDYLVLQHQPYGYKLVIYIK